MLILFKQGSMTLIIFNLYNIVYSCGIHIRFKDISINGINGSGSDLGLYVISTIFMCVVIIVCFIVVVII